MNIVHLLPILLPKWTASEALSQDIGALQQAYGGHVLSLQPHARLPPPFPRGVFVFLCLAGLPGCTFWWFPSWFPPGWIAVGTRLVGGLLSPRLPLPLATVLFNLSQYLLTTVVFLPMMLIFYQETPCLLYKSPRPRDRTRYRLPSSA